MEKTMQPIIESYNVDEEYLYVKPYIFIKGYAHAKNLKYTLKALPLARCAHNGQYRKGNVLVNNKIIQLPYILHPLKVCSTLISLNLPMTNEELDILYASAIMHDIVEDRPDLFPKGGKELTSEYGFPEEVYTIIKLLSKFTGATEFELNEYFNKIKKNPLALLIKLADRSHNVEDLHSFRTDKLHKYTKETRRWIYDLCSYGKQHYPDYSNGFTILKSKIVSLTEEAETLIEKYEENEQELKRLHEEEFVRLGKQIAKLKALLNKTYGTCTSEHSNKQPDDAITIADMKEYGYTCENMLPLTEKVALFLFVEEEQIFLLYQNNTAVPADNITNITEHAKEGGIFGIHEDDWKLRHIKTTVKQTN